MSYSITKREISTQLVLIVRRRIQQAEIAATLGEVFPRVFQYAQQAGTALAGPPFTRYPEWGPGLITIEAGMPVAASVPGDADIVADSLPGGVVATTIHAGPYDRLTDAYAAMQVWIKEQGLSPSGAPWEVYVTDPAEHPDPKDWKTEIFWPLAS